MSGYQAITRTGWGAAPPRGAPQPVPARERTAVMLHYSTGEELGRADTGAWVRQIQAWHQQRNGWADIGYNWLVDVAGRIWTGRGWGPAGAHCPGWNRSAWGICFLGDDDPGQDVTEEARAALVALTAHATHLAGHQLRVLGHRDGRSTTCPGDEIYQWLRAGMPLVGGAPAGPGGIPIAVDGRPGPRTWRAVQAHVGLTGADVDAIPGPFTWRAVQVHVGLDGAAVDGRPGRVTWSAVQAHVGLDGPDVDGLPGPRTWTAVQAHVNRGSHG